jgi:hypothetical protein
VVLSLPLSNVQFALSKPCSKDDDADNDNDDNITDDKNILFLWVLRQ